MQTVIASEATGVKPLNLDLVPKAEHGWTEGRNFRFDSATATHRELAARFCAGVSPEALEQMTANGVDLIAMQAKFADALAEISRLRAQLQGKAAS